jgi:hypothetical protein
MDRVFLKRAYRERAIKGLYIYSKTWNTGNILEYQQLNPVFGPVFLEHGEHQ